METRCSDFKWFVRFLHDLECESSMPFAFEMKSESIADIMSLSPKGKEEVIYYLRDKYHYVEKFTDEQLFTLPIKTELFGLKLTQPID